MHVTRGFEHLRVLSVNEWMEDLLVLVGYVLYVLFRAC